MSATRSAFRATNGFIACTSHNLADNTLREPCEALVVRLVLNLTVHGHRFTKFGKGFWLFGEVFKYALLPTKLPQLFEPFPLKVSDDFAR